MRVLKQFSIDQSQRDSLLQYILTHFSNDMKWGHWQESSSSTCMTTAVMMMMMMMPYIPLLPLHTEASVSLHKSRKNIEQHWSESTQLTLCLSPDAGQYPSLWSATEQNHEHWPRWMEKGGFWSTSLLWYVAFNCARIWDFINT